MKASVVIRSRDEAARLRLTLASLERQAGLAEVIVVDDGSIDDTPAVLADAAARLPLVSVRNAAPAGRAAASNRGAAAASAALLVFLDGDTLAAPDMVAAHLAAHADAGTLIGRGETWHLRCTRFLADPETARFWPHEAARAAATPIAERQAMRVTLGQVRGDFAAIVGRARPGIYPGAAPAALHAAEMAALARASRPERLWAAASGSNLSVPRHAFLASGGFDPGMTINEHRELAWRLCAAGAWMRAVPKAMSLHLTHRTGWRDPLADPVWSARFAARHPDAPVASLIAFWRGLSGLGPATDFFAAA